MRKKKKQPVPPLLLNLTQVNNNSVAQNINSSNLLGHNLCDPAISQSFQVSLGIDFTFNTIKNVKKVAWKEDAPWYREISDGMCWLCYCQNTKCPANKQLVVINKGFGVFSIGREMQVIRCPCCMSTKQLQVRNCGFVNCEWAMRGIL